MSLHPDIERLAQLGWRLFPSARSRKGMFKGYVQAATSDLSTADLWSRRYPDCNWSVIPEGSGIWALDLDVPSPDHAADGVSALRELCRKFGELPSRPHGRSGGGGHLLVFRDVGHRICTKTGTPVPGIDPRAGNVSFTVAPSIHRHGGCYRWLVPPWELEPPAAPNWLLQQVAPPHRPRMPKGPVAMSEGKARWQVVRAVDRVLEARPGERNATLNRQAFSLGRLAGTGCIDVNSSLAALYQAARYAGLNDGECRTTIRSGFAAGLKLPLRT